MAPVPLNTDVLRLVIRCAAVDAEQSTPSLIEGFHLRTSILRKFALVNSEWAALAQAELAAYLVLTTANYAAISWQALELAGSGTMEDLRLVNRLSSNPAAFLNTLASWLPTTRTVEMAEFDASTPVVPSLRHCRRLERLTIQLSHLPATLAVLDCPLRHLEIVGPTAELDAWTWEDYHANVLNAIGKSPLDRVETVKVLRSPGVDDSPGGSREVALLVKMGTRKTRAASKQVRGKL
ncbi:hypothetical protein JCM10212_002432 [Sporobolomyces blumeae]